MKRKEREARVQAILARSLKDMGRSRSMLKGDATVSKSKGGNKKAGGAKEVVKGNKRS